MDEKKKVALHIISQLDKLTVESLTMLDVFLAVYIKALNDSGEAVKETEIVTPEVTIENVVETLVEYTSEKNDIKDITTDVLQKIIPTGSILEIANNMKLTMEDRVHAVVTGIAGPSISEKDTFMLREWEDLYTKEQVLRCLIESYRNSSCSLKHTDSLLKTRYPKGNSDLALMDMESNSKLRFAR
jgi:hypothetical protein